MSINLIELIKGQLGASTVSQAATQLGESESGVSKAISVLFFKKNCICISLYQKTKMQ